MPRKTNKTAKEKTNVIRAAETAGVEFQEFSYDNTVLNAQQVALLLNQDAAKVYKTLVTQGKSEKYYVFMLPAEAELDLKKAAKAAGEKSIEMIPQKLLFPLTGFVHGGCSPIGMKKKFKTFIHFDAQKFDKIFFSAGKTGRQISMSLKDLQKIIEVTPADIARG